MAAGETSFFCREGTCVSIVCFVAWHLLCRPRVLIDEETKNPRKNQTRPFLATAAEFVLRASTRPANAESRGS